jgi:hypothetical protein
MGNGSLALEFGVPATALGEVSDAADVAGSEAPRVEIPFTWSEAHRHDCEVRYCFSRGRAWTLEFCVGVTRHRGRTAAERLWRDVARLAKDEGGWRS